MRTPRILTRYAVCITFAVCIGATLAAGGSLLAFPSPPLQASITYVVSPSVQTLYPDQSWLPAPYKPHYQSLAATIQKFTEQSLQRDGIPFTSVSATQAGIVTIESTDPRAQDYAVMHPIFFDTSHALQGLHGVALCKTVPGCWDPQSNPQQPWAFFLPVGLPLVNQKAVMLMDYPPATSLIQGDYLNNATLDRWSRVLQAVGISNPVLYEAIVDIRPVAAPGTGQERAMEHLTQYFNTQGSDHFYITPMVALLTNPPTHSSSSHSLPVAVFGAPARAAWGAIIQNSGAVDILQVGVDTLPGATKETYWVATNHPNVTAYQCCPGDPYPNCVQSKSYSLVWNEQIDLQAACIIEMLAGNQSLHPATAKQQCTQQWGLHPSVLPPANAHMLCMQAKLDNTNPTARCPTVQDADAYCTEHQNNPCATFTCQVP